MTFGERLKQARTRSGLTQEALARQVSVEKMSISKYESGKMMPSSSTLIALSKALAVDVEFFFREFSVTMQSRPHFREVRGGKLSVSEKKQIVAETEEALSRQHEVFAICEYSMPKPDAELRRYASNMQDVDALAEEVRKAWDLGLDPIDNLMETAESHGFSIVLVDGAKDFDAAVFLDEPSGPVISIKAGVSRERQRFTLAHELGHYFVLDRGADSATWNEETRANRFAASFLVPRKMLVSDVGEHRTSLDVRELNLLREKYGVSIEMLLFRLYSAGIISQKLMKDYVSKARLGLLNDASERKFSEEPRVVKRLVYRAVAEGVISEQKGFELLGESGGISSNPLEAS